MSTMKRVAEWARRIDRYDFKSGEQKRLRGSASSEGSYGGDGSPRLSAERSRTRFTDSGNPFDWSTGSSAFSAVLQFARLGH